MSISHVIIENKKKSKKKHVVHFNLIISIGLRCVGFFYICKGATIYFPGGGELLSIFKINMFRLNFVK